MGIILRLETKDLQCNFLKAPTLQTGNLRLQQGSQLNKFFPVFNQNSGFFRFIVGNGSILVQVSLFSVPDT